MYQMFKDFVFATMSLVMLSTGHFLPIDTQQNTFTIETSPVPIQNNWVILPPGSEGELCISVNLGNYYLLIPTRMTNGHIVFHTKKMICYTTISKLMWLIQMGLKK